MFAAPKHWHCTAPSTTLPPSTGVARVVPARNDLAGTLGRMQPRCAFAVSWRLTKPDVDHDAGVEAHAAQRQHGRVEDLHARRAALLVEAAGRERDAPLVLLRNRIPPDRTDSNDALSYSNRREQSQTI